MKTIIYTILLTFLLTFSVTAQQASNPNGEIILRVEIENNKPLTFKTSDLAKLPRRETKAKDHNGKETTFSGVNLVEVLKLAGVKFGKDAHGANLITYLTVEAADNYRVVFAMTELDADFTDKIVLLADARDGKTLSKEEGSFRLVIPDEKKQGRWVRQVIVLKVKKTQ